MFVVLMYEPDNTEALSFQPLIEEKLALGLTSPSHSQLIVFVVCWPTVPSGPCVYHFTTNESLEKFLGNHFGS